MTLINACKPCHISKLTLNGENPERGFSFSDSSHINAMSCLGLCMCQATHAALQIGRRGGVGDRVLQAPLQHWHLTYDRLIKLINIMLAPTLHELSNALCLLPVSYQPYRVTRTWVKFQNLRGTFITAGKQIFWAYPCMKQLQPEIWLHSYPLPSSRLSPSSQTLLWYFYPGVFSVNCLCSSLY